MCGIAGVLGKETLVAQHQNRLPAALAEIAYRGPDDSGIESGVGYAVGHVRLSIIDLSSAAHQPMRDSEGAQLIAYNGEVYNFPELRAELRGKAAQFRSTSDTEVVLAMYRAHGVGAFAQLNGMFAFAIIDEERRKGYLVRDRLGIKPLHYAIVNGGIIFGSEIKALDKLRGDIAPINVAALGEWTYFGSTLRDRTLYQGIKRLLPGHYIECDLSTGDTAVGCYWVPERALRNGGTVAQGNERSIAAEVRRRLEKAVTSQLVGDVPVGVFLSGGIDSSAITAFASRHYPSKLQTFSVGFDYDRGVNELDKAREVARRFGTEHHELHVSGYDLADVVERLVHHHDLPFADAANIPLYLLGKKVEGSIKVVLQGDGGDELFAGYRRYRILAASRYWSPFIRAAAAMHKVLPRRGRYFARQRFLNALSARSDAERMALLLTVEDRFSEPTGIFKQPLRAEIDKFDPFAAYRECDHRFGDLDLAQRMLFTDTQIILPDIFLEKVDRSTMAASVEVRVPFLDNALVEYVLGLPSTVKIRKGQSKWLLKEGLRGILPDSILFGPKTGFGVPYQYWLRGPLRDFFWDKYAQLKACGEDIFDAPYLQRIMKAHAAGHRDHGFLLWKALNLMLWLLRRANGGR